MPERQPAQEDLMQTIGEIPKTPTEIVRARKRKLAGDILWLIMAYEEETQLVPDKIDLVHGDIPRRTVDEVHVTVRIL
jgi:hypothetical protein